MAPGADATATLLEIERCAVRAVPPAETVEIGGWSVMAGAGVVQRTNSVTTFGIDPEDRDGAVETVEDWYAERGRPVRFRLTDLDLENGLDALLDARGLVRSPDVLVMTARREHREVEPPATDLRVDLDPTAAWFDALGRLAAHEPARTAELAAGLALLDLPYGAFQIRDRGFTLAVGLAVVDDVEDRRRVGLFDIAVDAAVRRRGLGRRITAAMLDWAVTEHGVDRAYLQVASTNEPAVSLYRRLGFEIAYRYWYRTSPH